jgi:hypothetical protein
VLGSSQRQSVPENFVLLMEEDYDDDVSFASSEEEQSDHDFVSEPPSLIPAEKWGKRQLEPTRADFEAENSISDDSEISSDWEEDGGVLVNVEQVSFDGSSVYDEEVEVVLERVSRSLNTTTSSENKTKKFNPF